MELRKSLAAFAFVAVLAAVGCSREMLGLPRTPMSATSPDGKWVAFARNHPTIDGPDQSIWLRPAGGSGVQLRKLGGDAEWISAIAWSADSRRVAFLTMDAVIDIYDTATRKQIASGHIRQPNGSYPPKYAVRDVSLSADGATITYVPCERNPYVLNSRPERLSCSGDQETLAVDGLADRQARLYPGRAF
jgi:WD40 repeat protein